MVAAPQCGTVGVNSTFTRSFEFFYLSLGYYEQILDCVRMFWVRNRANEACTSLVRMKGPQYSAP